MVSHDKKIANLSPQSGHTAGNLVNYESGDCYYGELTNGLRDGIGTYTEYNSNLVFNGEWFDD